MSTQCIGGPALATICRVICEDYTKRASGVPDLLIWNASDEKVRFVEVKGPGDTLMEGQKVRSTFHLACRSISHETAHVPIMLRYGSMYYYDPEST